MIRFLLSLFKYDFKNSLALRLLLYVVLCSAVFSVLATAVQLYSHYKNYLSDIEKNITFIENSYVPAITSTTYDLNIELLQIQLKGVTRLGDINYVAVYELRDKTKLPIVSVGSPTARQDIIKEFPMYYAFDMKRAEPFAYLHVGITLAGVYSKLWEELGRIIIINLAKTLITSIFIFFIIQFIAIRHIRKIAGFTERVDLKNIDKNLVLDRKKKPWNDELARLVESINFMLTKIKLSDEEARQMNKELEHIVHQRTLSLNNAKDKYKKTALSLQHTNARLKEKITEINRMQSQMIQSEKLVSIGQLAAGIAHEINNPTGFISSNLNTMADYQKDIHSLIQLYRQTIQDLAQTDRQTDQVQLKLQELAAREAEVDIDYLMEDTAQLVAESIDGAGRIKKIVRDMKDLMHPGTEQTYEMTDINYILDSTLNIVNNELKYKVTLEKNYGDLPLIPCIQQQVGQIFINILINASHAIETKGTVTITTWADDDYVNIRIADTGKGIPKENLNKIFDPFFTSKPVGKGTGLGLHISYNMVKNHRGKIHLHSTVDQGTEFTIKLPVKKTQTP